MCRYKCDHCGREFEEPDFVEETHGLDAPPYERIAVCPYCKGYFEEMYQCKICGEWYTDDELTSGVCDNCIYDNTNNYELCYELGDEECVKETITLNGFIASIFPEDVIAEILMNEIRNAKNCGGFVSCMEFIGSDKSWFADKLVERKEKNDAESF